MNKASAMPLKILFVSHSSGWAGAEHCLYWLAEGLDQNRFRPVVALPGAGILEDKLGAIGVRCYRTSAAPWWVGPHTRDPAMLRRFADGLAQRVEALTELIGGEDPDLVFTNTLAVVEGALAARRAGRPHIWYAHEMPGRTPGLEPIVDWRRLVALVEQLSARVVAVSQSARSTLLQYAPEARVQVVHSGLPGVRALAPAEAKRRQLGLGKQDPVVCFAGMLIPAKGVLDLARAAPVVLARHPGAKFLVAGPDGGQLPELRHELHRAGVARAFRILGYRPDVLEIMSCSDVLALPSVADSFPLAVLEAMAVGLPVVATRSGGAAELIIDGATGVLVPVGEPAALGAAIAELLADPDKRRAMGERAALRARTFFTRARFVRNFEKLFAELAEAGPPAEPPPEKQTEDPERLLAREALSRAAQYEPALGSQDGRLGSLRRRLLGLPDPAGRRLARAIFLMEGVLGSRPGAHAPDDAPGRSHGSQT